MKQLIALLALAALTACGVDGVPERPNPNGALVPGKNVSPQSNGSDWISGTISMHTATRI